MSQHPRVDSIRCRWCDCPRSTVAQTHVFEFRGKHHIRRKRRCNHCGHHFTTVEMIEDDDQKGVPAVLVDTRHPIDIAATPPKPAKPLIPPHPLDVANQPLPAGDPLQQYLGNGHPPPASDSVFIKPAPVPSKSPALSSPEKPPKAGQPPKRSKNPYAP